MKKKQVKIFSCFEHAINVDLPNTAYMLLETFVAQICWKISISLYSYNVNVLVKNLCRHYTLLHKCIFYDTFGELT